jgi:hypothetical protein
MKFRFASKGKLVPMMVHTAMGRVKSDYLPILNLYGKVEALYRSADRPEHESYAFLN